MADIVSKAKRSQMMAGIRGKDTKPELIIRSLLHRAGFRFRLHRRTLPGKPDIVLAKYNAVIFVHGCFWHVHSCHLFRMPSSKTAFWKAKLQRNVNNDEAAVAKLLRNGWRVGIVWECALKGRSKNFIGNTGRSLRDWLLSESKYLEIKGIA